MTIRTSIYVGIGAALLVGAAAWVFTGTNRGPDPIMDVFGFCETIPDPSAADSGMAALGWAPLPDDRLDELNTSIALFFTGARRASMDDFSFEQERANFESRIADNIEKLAGGIAKPFVGADGISFAQIEWIDGIPNAVGCDVMLPAPANTTAFSDLITDGEASGNSRAWSTSLMSEGQRPRPGIWVANLVQISPDTDLTAFLGAAPDRQVLAAAAYRGELEQ